MEKSPGLKTVDFKATTRAIARARRERARGEVAKGVPKALFAEVARAVARIRRERIRRGLRAEDVARVAELSRVTVSKIENGWNASPNVETLWRLADAVGLDLVITLRRKKDG